MEEKKLFGMVSIGDVVNYIIDQYKEENQYLRDYINRSHSSLTPLTITKSEKWCLLEATSVLHWIKLFRIFYKKTLVPILTSLILISGCNERQKTYFGDCFTLEQTSERFACAFHR